jgi:REP element-mobilizing transposase RayT
MRRMSETLGIHWTATTHGTWLHGDPRGSWRDGRLIGPDPFLEESIRVRTTHDAILLDLHERQQLAAKLGEVVRERRYRAFAATVQAAHVHIVFAPIPESIKTAIARLKRRTAAFLLAARRDAVHSNIPRSLWTEGQFPIFIFHDYHLINAIEYVRDHNRRAGLPPDPFDWIEPLYPPGEFIGERMCFNRLCERPPT